MNINFDKIDFKKIDNIGIISLNRPDFKNVLDIDVFREINHSLDLFENDKKIKVILFKANSCTSKSGKKIFSAGVNLKEYDEKFSLVRKSPEEFKKMLEYSRSVLTKIETLTKPVIACVDGIAVGGAFEIILACDIVLASDKAEFYLSEVNIGLIPGYGGIFRLLRLLGKNRTFEVIATAKQINAKEAFSLGIVNKIYLDNEFEDEIIKYAKLLSKKSLNSLKLLKNTICEINKEIQYNEFEVENFLKAIKSHEAIEGVHAFLEKREPRF